MNTDDKINWILFEAYFAGTSTPEERDEVERWIAAAPDHQHLTSHLRHFWETRQHRPISDWGRDEAIAHVLASVRSSSHVSNVSARTSRAFGQNTSAFTPWARRTTGSSALLKWGGLGGAMAAIAIVVGFMFQRNTTSHTRPAKTYATAIGQRATIRLADGSRVTLAPQTTLTVDDVFGTRTRTVRLVGEAHFEVTPGRQAPFKVQTHDVTVQVLGTVFDVRRYANDVVGRVTVTSGKVMAQGRGTPVTLTAGVTGQFRDSVATTSTVPDLNVYADWANGRLIFRDAPVPVVLAELSRWYGYEFHLSDSTLASRNVTTTFTFSKTDEMFRLLRRLLGVRMTFQDSVVTLRPDRDANVPLPARERRGTLLSHRTSTEVGL